MSGLLNSGLNGSTSNLPDTTGRAFTTSFSAQSGSTAPVLDYSGTIQGLHSIHGNFNIPNMPGTFTSRNSPLNGGPPTGIPQAAGGISNGQLMINSLPAAVSQLSPASSHGHSRVIDNGGVSSNLGYVGRITNSMGNLIIGGNIGRDLSISGGVSMPSVASRLNLTGGLLSQDQFQAGTNHLALLNELNVHGNATFDIHDFPQLRGQPTSDGGSQGQSGLMSRRNVRFIQQKQEFSMQNEDFPALPGYKGGNDEFPFDMHHKEQLSVNMHPKEELHASMASTMQSQHLPMARYAGFSLGSTYSLHHQQQQQNPPSVGGGSISFIPANNRDPHFHGSEARSMGLPATGLRPKNLSNTMSGVGSYDQLIQQHQHSQKQSQFRLVSQFRDQDLKSTQESQAVTDQFGLLGLLSVIRMSDPDLTLLALGIDLMTLGLNLNSPENLHKKFASPWSEDPAKGEPQFSLPECYSTKKPPELSRGCFSRFRQETLFYIFYSMPKDKAQLHAAHELHTRGWFYHRVLHLWFIRVTNIEPLVKTNAYERGCYFCFDPRTWEMTRKDNFVLQYEDLEKRPTLPQQ